MNIKTIHVLLFILNCLYNMADILWSHCQSSCHNFPVVATFKSMNKMDTNFYNNHSYMDIKMFIFPGKDLFYYLIKILDCSHFKESL